VLQIGVLDHAVREWFFQRKAETTKGGGCGVGSEFWMASWSMLACRAVLAVQSLCLLLEPWPLMSSEAMLDGGYLA
jgi:hypothetical protein